MKTHFEIPLEYNGKTSTFIIQRLLSEQSKIFYMVWPQDAQLKNDLKNFYITYKGGMCCQDNNKSAMSCRVNFISKINQVPPTNMELSLALHDAFQLRFMQNLF